MFTLEEQKQRISTLESFLFYALPDDDFGYTATSRNIEITWADGASEQEVIDVLTNAGMYEHNVSVKRVLSGSSITAIRARIEPLNDTRVRMTLKDGERHFNRKPSVTGGALFGERDIAREYKAYVTVR